MSWGRLCALLLICAPCATCVLQTAVQKKLVHYAHNSDFIHRFYIPGQWWCSIYNLFQEFKHHDQASYQSLTGEEALTERFKRLKKREEAISLLGLPVDIPEDCPLPDSDEGRLARWAVQEAGLLYFDRGEEFNQWLQLHGALEKDGKVGQYIFHPSLWAHAENIAADNRFFRFVMRQCSDKVPVKSVVETISKASIVDEETMSKASIVDEVAMAKRKLTRPITRAKAISLGFMRMVTENCEIHGDDDDRQFAFTNVDNACHLSVLKGNVNPYKNIDCKPVAVGLIDNNLLRYLMEWYAQSVAKQNEYRYHDHVHTALFAEAMYLQSRKLQRWIREAATVAGLYHDIGYPLLYVWLRVTLQCRAHYDTTDTTLPVCQEPDHKGHELVSLIAVVDALRKVQRQHPTVSDERLEEIIDVMSYVILATKIYGFPMKAPTVDDIRLLLKQLKGISREELYSKETPFYNKLFLPVTVTNPVSRTKALHLLYCLSQVLQNTNTKSEECSALLKIVHHTLGVQPAFETSQKTQDMSTTLVTARRLAANEGRKSAAKFRLKKATVA